MSSKNKVEVACSQCSEEQSVIVWSSLNVTLNPKAQEDLFSRKINIFQCKECGSEIKVLTRLLYHDMEQKFCVQYIPIESVIKEESLIFEFNQYGELQNDSNEEEKDKSYDYMNHIHLVFDMEELLRYVLFRDKLFEDYKEFQVTAKIREKLLDVRDKTRSGKLDTGDKPYYIKPEDLL